jgi:isopentenyldiphosphate isomerase
MGEIITTYDLKKTDVAVPMDRDKFYAEQVKVFKKTGKTTRAIETIMVLIFNLEGELLLQKRSHRKSHNASMIDKTVAGHVTYGDTPLYTVMFESVQELKVPSIVLNTEEEFKKAFKLLRKYMESVALVKYIDTKIMLMERMIKGKKVDIAYKYNFFIGLYNGSVKPVDKEASGVLFYDLKVLAREMKSHPDNFTWDLFYLLKKYDKEIKKIMKMMKSNRNK